MEYTGIIKGSRTLDLTAVSMMVDAASLSFLAYEPEKLGITVPVYAAVRIVLGVLAAYLRFQTRHPVGEKP